MLFNSLHFLVFFPIVTVAYFLLPHKYRWFLLLMASCYFYMVFKPIYILILAFTIVVDYIAGIMIEGASGKRRKWFLVMSIVANVGVLAAFKYYNFLNENISELLGIAAVDNPIPYLNILLPIGLSFHTFQAMSYTIEVYRGHHKAERNFGLYSLYVMFYPQLVAGPIERPNHLLPQFRKRMHLRRDNVVIGLRQMLWGFFKKVVIADNLALLVNQVYDNPDGQNGITYLIGTYCFAFQIYCDFSGYSDIARGAARIMGFEIMKNFNVPYIARSIREFWSRWHVSLSTWFRDYLYVPLGGNRVTVPRWGLNIMIVFLISGLWHGANWTFVIWGGLHGAYLLIERFLKGFGISRWWSGNGIIPRFCSVLVTFHLVLVAWIFFRAASAADAMSIIQSIATTSVSTIQEFLSGGPTFLGFGEISIRSVGFLVLAFLLLYLADSAKEHHRAVAFFNRHGWFRFLIYVILFYGIVFLGYFGETQFIYFQF